MGKKNVLSIIEIQQWIQEKISTCSLCKSADWDLEPEIFRMAIGNPRGNYPHKKFDCAILSCKNCGNTHFIDAKRLALSATGIHNWQTKAEKTDAFDPHISVSGNRKK